MNTIYNQLKESPFMEKKIILLMLMALFSMFANAQQISSHGARHAVPLIVLE